MLNSVSAACGAAHERGVQLRGAPEQPHALRRPLPPAVALPHRRAWRHRELPSSLTHLLPGPSLVDTLLARDFRSMHRVGGAADGACMLLLYRAPGHQQRHAVLLLVAAAGAGLRGVPGVGRRGAPPLRPAALPLLPLAHPGPGAALRQPQAGAELPGPGHQRHRCASSHALMHASDNPCSSAWHGMRLVRLKKASAGS